MPRDRSIAGAKVQFAMPGVKIIGVCVFGSRRNIRQKPRRCSGAIPNPRFIACLFGVRPHIEEWTSRSKTGRAKGITGKDAEAALGRAYITVNKNAIPNDPEKPMVTSGIRIGSPAMTTRGFGRAEAEKIAHLVADVLEDPKGETACARVTREVKAMCAKFPVYV